MNCPDCGEALIQEAIVLLGNPVLRSRCECGYQRLEAMA